MSAEPNQAPVEQVFEIPEVYAAKVADIVEYTRTAFAGDKTFEWNINPGEHGSLFLVGPYGTLVIALGVTPSGHPDESIDAISVSLDACPHLAAVSSHAYATKFGLVFMDPHAQGVGEAYNQVLFGQAAYHAKSVLDEARLRAKVVELTQEASRQVSKENEPTMAEKIMAPPKELVDAHGRVLK